MTQGILNQTDLIELINGMDPEDVIFKSEGARVLIVGLNEIKMLVKIAFDFNDK